MSDSPRTHLLRWTTPCHWVYETNSLSRFFGQTDDQDKDRCRCVIIVENDGIQLRILMVHDPFPERLWNSVTNTVSFPNSIPYLLLRGRPPVEQITGIPTSCSYLLPPVACKLIYRAPIPSSWDASRAPTFTNHPFKCTISRYIQLYQDKSRYVKNLRQYLTQYLPYFPKQKNSFASVFNDIILATGSHILGCKHGGIRRQPHGVIPVTEEFWSKSFVGWWLIRGFILFIYI